MKIANVKNMSDKEVYNLLNSLSNKNVRVCCRCGEILYKENRITLYSDVSKMPKKLCSLCKNCYTELLDYLGVNDI